MGRKQKVAFIKMVKEWEVQITGTFSFYPTKNLAAFGDAGAITTNNKKLAEEDIVCIRNHGRSPEGHRLVGRNSRCDHLQAAVLDLKLDHIVELNNNRKEIASMYLEALKRLSHSNSKARIYPTFFNAFIPNSN